MKGARRTLHPFVIPGMVLFLFFFTLDSPRLPGQTVNLTPEGELQEKSPATSSDASQLVTALESRKSELDKRAEELDLENQRLQALKNEISGLLKKLSQDRAAEEKLKSPDRIDPGQLEHLARMYEAMPPKDAAARIEKLKEPLTLKLLSSLKPKTAARILNEIKPSKAASLTEKLAKTSPAEP